MSQPTRLSARGQDLTGRTFGRLTVLGRDPQSTRGRWACRCVCGEPRSYDGYMLLKGQLQSCGCHRRAIEAAARTALVGKVFGRLTVVAVDSVSSTSRGLRWQCICVCGSQHVVAGRLLLTGKSSSCGCTQYTKQGTPHIDLTGCVFTRLTVLRYATATELGRAYGGWMCQCVCGTVKPMAPGDLLDGSIKSCGCWIRDVTIARSTTHKQSKTPLYKIWQGMLNRCTRTNQAGYENYGGRGIIVCDRWVESFEAFAADVGPRPSPQHSLDRHPDTDGNYEPGNVRWATTLEQNHNKRNNVKYTYAGETLVLAEWVRRLGVCSTTIKRWCRLFDDDFDRVVAVIVKHKIRRGEDVSGIVNLSPLTVEHSTVSIPPTTGDE